jgi:transcriptional regulator with XRE-family HTH domain
MSSVFEYFYEFFSYLFLNTMQDPIGQRIELVRKTYYSSQTELAKAVNLTQSAISRAESEGSLSKELALFMRNTHNINLNWLYTGEGEMIEASNKDVGEWIKKHDELQVLLEELTFDLNELIKERALLRNKLKKASDK